MDMNDAIKSSVIALLMLLIFSLDSIASFQFETKCESTSDIINQVDYVTLEETLNMSLIKEHLRYLTKEMYDIYGIKTRATGTLGNILAAQYIYNKFVEYGLEDVHFFNFTVPVPKSYGANITFSDGSILEIYPVLPNLVCPSTTHKEGIFGRLIYAGEGYLEDFDTQKVEGSIVILDYESNYRWLNAMKLGAKAVIFLPAKDPQRAFSPYGHHYTHPKYLENFPVNFPRFYAENKDLLLSHLGENVTIKSTVRWEPVISHNILGLVRGKDYPNIIFGLSSYYDSYSFAPDLAPGAQDACGIAVLLELAKYFSENKPKASILFIAFGGHYQTIAGALSWADSEEYAKIGQNLWMILNLDISTGSKAIHITNIGYLWTYPQAGHTEVYVPIAQYLQSVQKKINDVRLSRGLSPYQAWTTWVTARLTGPGGFDEPMPNRAYITELDAFDVWSARSPDYCNPAFFNIMTALDIRPYIFTPYDIYDRINFENLEVQARFIHALLLTVYKEEDPIWLTQNPLSKCNPKGRCPRNGAYVGQTAVWDPETNWYKPVGNLLVVARMYYSINKASGWSNFQGTGPTFYRFYTFSGNDGTFRFPYTVRISTRAWVGSDDEIYFEAYAIDPETGNIVIGPDLGQRKFISYPFANEIWEGKYGDYYLGFLLVQNISSVIIIPDNYRPGEWVSRNLYNRFPHPLISVNNFWTHVTLEHYAVIYDSALGLAAIFLGSQEPVEILIGGRPPYAILVNASKNNRLGSGCTFSRGQTILTLPYIRYAENLRWILEERFSTLEKYRVTHPYAYQRFMNGISALENAILALKNYYYSKAYAFSMDAWRDLYWVYLYQRDEIENIIVVAPYLAILLVPFVYLTERLLFKTLGAKRVLCVILLAVLFSFILTFVHPSFSVAGNPELLILASSTIILSIPIIFLIVEKALKFIKDIKVKIFGAHEIKTSKIELSLSAWHLGIENMRRRKMRTSLVLISIIVSISALVALTSTFQLTIFGFQQFYPEEPITPYRGILIHHANWGGEREAHWLGDLIENYIAAKYSGNNLLISKRAWYWPWYPTEGGALTVSHKNNSIKIFCLQGLSPQDSWLTSLLPSFQGRWFIESDKYVCILSSSQAEQLNATIDSIIKIQEMPYRVIGIYSDNEMSLIRDLDGKSVLPPDIRALGTVDAWKLHYEPGEVIILPWWTIVNIWGSRTGCIVLRSEDTTLLSRVAFDLFHHGLNIYVCLDDYGKILIPQSIMVTRISGLEYQIPTIIISMLSILNLMLGAIVERRREISTYSVIGASPLNTVIMFISEHIVYAILGGFLGYIFGNIILKVSGQSLSIYYTYTTSSLFIAVGFSMLMILLASLYPALIIAKMVTPSLERVWKIPTKPVGDRWDVPLPFFAKDEVEASSAIKFLEEFVKGHYDSNAPVFWTENVEVTEGIIDETPYKGVKMLVHLFPYETGVTQESIIISQPYEGRWRFLIFTKRLTGTLNDWVRLNRNFIDAIRKQLLLWRTMSTEEKQKYASASFHN